MSEGKILNEIIHGDSVEVMRTLPEKIYDCCITDPPYKLSQKYTTSTDSDNIMAVASIYNVAIELKRVVKDGGLCVVFYDNRILPMALDAYKKAGWKYIRCLTLYRRAGSAFNMCGWMSTSDIILIFQNGEGKLNFYGKCSHDVYIKDKMEKVSYGHPAQKPEWIIEDILQRIAEPNMAVIDPYSGSGTTCAVAKKLGINYTGIEQELEFVEVSKKRVGDFNKNFEPQTLFGNEM